MKEIWPDPDLPEGPSNGGGYDPNGPCWLVSAEHCVSLAQVRVAEAEEKYYLVVYEFL